MSAILLSLHTKRDMETFATRLETSLRGDIQKVKQSISALESKVTTLSTEQFFVQQCLTSLEETCSGYQQKLSCMCLQHDDLENRHRRNNIKLRGIPEAVETTDLRATVIGIFNDLLGKPASSPIELDRVHRINIPSQGERSQPRDVLCRVCIFTTSKKRSCVELGTEALSNSMELLYTFFPTCPARPSS